MNFGTIVYEMMKTLRELDNDPMSRAYGFYPNILPEAKRILKQKFGMTVQDFMTYLRCVVSARWIYFSGLEILEE